MIEYAWGDSTCPDFREYLARWCSDHIWDDANRQFGNCVCMGIFLRKELIAVITYHNWDPQAGIIEFSGASTSPRWLTRKIMMRMFSYPFEDLGCQMVVTRNAADNTRLHRQLKSYGFKSHPIPRLGGREKDQIVWTLTDDDWRSNGFQRLRHGQAERS